MYLVSLIYQLWNRFIAYMHGIHLHKAKPMHERLVVWSGAALAGLVVVIFIRLYEAALNKFFYIQHLLPHGYLLLSPLGGMIVVYCLRRWFRGAEGSGIPQVIAGLHEHHFNEHSNKLVSLRIAFGKIILGSAAVLFGFSTGREGPSVQISASIMHTVGRFLPVISRISPHQLLLAGGAAGIAAAFNTPLAGIVFAIEELARQFEQRTNGVMLTAIVIAGMVSTSLQGNYLYFGHLHIESLSSKIVGLVLSSALICGLLGGLFSRTLLWSATITPSLIWDYKKVHPVAFAGICGLLISILSYISHGTINGSGYDVTRSMVMQGTTMSWHYAPMKAFATILSYFSGVPGGIFAPALSIGAGIGNDLQILLGSAYSPHVIYALCMAGFLGAVTQAPITSAIIVMEMIDGHQMVLSLVAVTLLSSMVSRKLGTPLYHTLAEPMKRKVITT
jgi:H+/Cl- antiporter ClcA